MKKMTKKDFFMWSLTFTKRIILLVTLVWTVATIYEAIMIAIAVYTIENFSYLDTFISEVSSTFALICGTNICSKTVENIFRYNESLGGKSIYKEDICDDSEDESCAESEESED